MIGPIEPLGPSDDEIPPDDAYEGDADDIEEDDVEKRHQGAIKFFSEVSFTAPASPIPVSLFTMVQSMGNVEIRGFDTDDNGEFHCAWGPEKSTEFYRLALAEHPDLAIWSIGAVAICLSSVRRYRKLRDSNMQATTEEDYEPSKEESAAMDSFQKAVEDMFFVMKSPMFDHGDGSPPHFGEIVSDLSCVFETYEDSKIWTVEAIAGAVISIHCLLVLWACNDDLGQASKYNPPHSQVCGDSDPPADVPATA